jgi:hypothetical protein
MMLVSSELKKWKYFFYIFKKIPFDVMKIEIFILRASTFGLDPFPPRLPLSAFGWPCLPLY